MSLKSPKVPPASNSTPAQPDLGKTRKRPSGRSQQWLEPVIDTTRRPVKSRGVNWF